MLEFEPSTVAYLLAITAIALTPSPFSALVFFLYASECQTFEELGFAVFAFAFSQIFTLFRPSGGRDD